MNVNQTPCRRPPKGTPKGTPKAILRELHKKKMMGKFFRNREPGYCNTPAGRITANLSRKHPDYNHSPAQHTFRKMKRAEAALKKGAN